MTKRADRKARIAQDTESTLLQSLYYHEKHEYVKPLHVFPPLTSLTTGKKKKNDIIIVR